MALALRDGSGLPGLATTRHMEMTFASYPQMVGSVQSSAARRFWCCYSLDHVARAPRLDGPCHAEALVGSQSTLGVGA